MKAVLAAWLVLVSSVSSLAGPPLDHRATLLERLSTPQARTNLTHQTQQVPVTMPSMTGWNIDLVDIVESGRCLATCFSGNVVYAAFEATLVVIDVSDPANPTRLGYAFLPGTCWDIARSGDYLYCFCKPLTSNIVLVVDVSNPASPVIVGSVPADGYSLDVEDHYLYIVYGDGFRVFDIATPTTPVLVGSTLSGASLLDDFVVRSGYIYVAAFSGGLRVIDATDPSDPHLVSTHPTGFGALAVDVQGSYAYLVNFLTPGPGLYVVDVSNPAVPATVGYFAAPNTAYIDVAVQGSHAFVLDNDSFLAVFDVMDPAQPLKVAAEPVKLFDPWTISLSGDLAMIGGGGGLRPAMCIVDVSNPPVPTSRGDYESLPHVGSVDIAGDHLALSLDLGILLTMNRYDTRQRHYSQTGHWDVEYSQVAVQGDVAFMADCNVTDENGSGVATFDVSDRTNPVEIGFLPFQLCARRVTPGTSHVYVAGWSGISVIDVSDPFNPTETGHVVVGANDIYAEEPYLYAAVGTAGLKIIDVTDPENPVIVGPGFPLGGQSYGVWVLDGYAFVAGAGAGGGLWIVDVSNPLNPTLAGTFDSGGSANTVRVRDHYAYLVDNGFVRIVDVSDPTSPTEVANIQASIRGQLALAPPYIYGIQRDGGHLLKFQTDFITTVPKEPHAPLALRQNYPNPFNPATTIAFELPSRSHARIDIFDVRGTLVRTLLDQAMPSGSHTVDWDGRDGDGNRVRSGVYFYRLTAGGRSEAKKMMILK